MQEINELVKNIFGNKARIVSPLIGGMMNQSFIVENENNHYVLYIPTPQANEMVDRIEEKNNQSLVYSLSLTCKNVYFDTISGVKANVYIKGDSLNKIPSYEPKKVSILLKTMHQSGLLANKDYKPFMRLENYKKEALSYYQLDNDYYALENIILTNKNFLESQKKVLAHNDAQKSNIIKGDDEHYYLIDFEFMANNDPIYDIATFGNNSVKEGREVLDIYFDNNPSKEEIKRYYLWRIFISLQWYLVAIIKHYNGEGKTHGYNFLDVANMFMANAKEAYENIK